MKQSVLIVLFVILFQQHSEAQLWKLRKNEITAGAGMSLFVADIGGYSRTIQSLGLKEMSFQQSRYDLNLNLKHRITNKITARVSMTYAVLHATDARGVNDGRDYEVNTSIFEPALIGEYYFVRNQAENNYGFNKGKGAGAVGFLRSLDFYLYTGIGGLNYSISANDNLINHGLDTKGLTCVIPFGIGGALVAFPDFNFGFEIGGRYTFSDNLDGYTPQYSSSNDVYYFFNLTLTYKLLAGKTIIPFLR